MADRVAVVLFNLGGPDRMSAVRPFLTNLFSDPAILRVPPSLRWLLARWITWRRAPVASEMYRHMGGGSPILDHTRAQATALECRLASDWRVFVAMRYWHPFAAETIAQVKTMDPDRIVLLPLYPQFSTTTTASSLRDWHSEAAKAGLAIPTMQICCYPLQQGWVAAQAALLGEAIPATPARFRVLFSAHGLPKSIVEQGDPYPRQIEAGARAIVETLGHPNLDWRVCYQSRVGRLEWLGPATDDEIRRAGAEGIALIVLPISFVSEHSETLVELDRDYARLAWSSGVRHYRRVPALGTAPDFIDGLARLAQHAAAGEPVAAATLPPPCGPGCGFGKDMTWMQPIPG